MRRPEQPTLFFAKFSYDFVLLIILILIIVVPFELDVALFAIFFHAVVVLCLCLVAAPNRLLWLSLLAGSFYTEIRSPSSGFKSPTDGPCIVGESLVFRRIGNTMLFLWRTSCYILCATASFYYADARL